MENRFPAAGESYICNRLWDRGLDGRHDDVFWLIYLSAPPYAYLQLNVSRMHLSNKIATEYETYITDNPYFALWNYNFG